MRISSLCNQGFKCRLHLDSAFDQQLLQFLNMVSSNQDVVYTHPTAHVLELGLG